MIGCSMILGISIKIIVWFVANKFFRTNLGQTQVSEWAVKLLISNLNTATRVYLTLWLLVPQKSEECMMGYFAKFLACAIENRGEKCCYNRSLRTDGSFDKVSFWWFKSFQPTLSYAAQMTLGEEIWVWAFP